jgi:hypothetical protein
MSHPSTQAAEAPVVSEEVWQAWLKKGKREEIERVKSVRILAGIAIALAALVIYALQVAKVHVQ